MSENKIKVAIAGAGAMGAGIAQVAAMAGHQVVLYDTNVEAADSALKSIFSSLDKLIGKGKIEKDAAEQVKSGISKAAQLEEIQGAGLFIEAIVENLAVKSALFSAVENILDRKAILATNTSSLSVTAIAAACHHPDRVIGLHFFNPAFLMPLVEVIPAMQSKPELYTVCMQMMAGWGKTPVLAKDTPGFIVNRVARPFYGESLRIFEEGLADIPTIDWAVKTFGAFKMGPFELMDLIGNDVNYTVTETVWTQMYFDQRYRPSLVQKKMMEAKRWGRKSGRGYYDYSEGASFPAPVKEEALGMKIFKRIICMLINEASDALYYKIASRDELDLAMTKGVNYPMGLLKWADELGPDVVLEELTNLYSFYGEDRYRPSVLLKEMAGKKLRFYP